MSDTKEKQHWAIKVSVDGQHVLTIESDGSLAGYNPLTAYEESIRTAAEHLTAFIGRPRPQ